MKKFVLFSLLLLLLAVSVSAKKYDFQCYESCRADCVLEKNADSINCDRICGDKCPREMIKTQVALPVAKLPAVPNCLSACRDGFTKCEQVFLIAKGKADCKKDYDACAGNCAPAAPRQSCGESCQQLASKSITSLVASSAPGFDMKTYLRCMKDQCQQSCEGACKLLGGDPYSCMLKECGTAVSCEGNCAVIREMCVAQGADASSCNVKVENCMNLCAPSPKTPECPARDCETKCAGAYYICANTQDKSSCTAQAGICLDACRPGVTPQRIITPKCENCEDTPCRSLCNEKYGKCIGLGTASDVCKQDSNACFKACPENIKPREEKKGFFASLWSSIKGK